MTLDVFELGYEAENRQPIGPWAHDHLKIRGSPYGERFLLDETPWLRAPLETVYDQVIQETILKCCAQGGKTLFMHIVLAFALARRPGPAMFVAQTIDAAKEQAKGRIIPLLESCPAIAAQLPQGKQRHQRSTRQILLPNCSLLMGPANENFLRSHTIQWLFGDECSEWDPGRMDQARARCTRVWNRKMFFASTPLDKAHDFEKSYNDGNQQRYHLPTPCCGELVYLTSDNLEKLFTWEENETTRPGGEWKYDELRETVRLNCPKCGAKHKQTPEMYRKMLDGAGYVVGNPNASSEIVSFAFNVFCLPPSVFSWGKIVELWLKAKSEELKGNLAPLKEFITLRLAESWDERAFLSYNVPSFLDYNPSDEWNEEVFRALTVDCQENLAEFYAVVRAWGKGGTSRLLDFARIHTEAEVKELQAQWKIKPHLVGLDSGHLPSQVFDMCVRNGWTAFLGDDRKEWLHSFENGVRIAMPFSPHERADPRTGKTYAGRSFCWRVKWSNPTIKDLLWQLKEGKGASWAVCDLGPDRSDLYAKLLDSERKMEIIDKFGRSVLHWKKRRQNHVWDAECMQVVYACLARLFRFGDESKKPDTSKDLASVAAAIVSLTSPAK